MSKCKHENATGYMWRVAVVGRPDYWSLAFTQPGDLKHHDRVICDSCGAWLSLGEANDTPEAMVEVRAAEIAHDWRLHRRKRLSSALSDICDGAEIAGWIESRFDSDRVPEQDGEWSGWLAQTIDSHDATHSEDA